MTLPMFSRENRRQRIEATFESPASIADALGDIDVPADIAAWLGRLLTLTGVPFQYLVPDEAMLPPESIRFFRLDDNWVQALLDGAFSLGRDLTAQAGDASTNLDHVLLGHVTAQAKAAAPLRPRTGVPAPDAGLADTVWTGFLLRSRVVSDYPGLGVNVYPKGHTPDDPVPMLSPVRRLDRLGQTGDTLFCLVHGDAYRVDVHEAPELLHYGIDRYTPPAETAAPTAKTAEKELRTFTRGADGTITLGPLAKVDVGTSFRPRSPRVLNMTILADALAQANATAGHADKTEPIDSALLGLVMTEGVGMVSFINRDAS
jgi:hypothetical protein